MEKRICRLCGKEGSLEKVLSRGNEFYVLRHYCPVKAAKKKAEKKEKELKDIKRIIGYGLEAFAVDTLDVFKKYPYKQSEDIFAPWTPEELAYQSGYLRLREIYFNFIKENLRRPNKREYKKMLEVF